MLFINTIPEKIQKSIKDLPEYRNNDTLKHDPNMLFGMAAIYGLIARTNYTTIIRKLYHSIFYPVLTGGKSKLCVGFKKTEPSEKPLIPIW